MALSSFDDKDCSPDADGLAAMLGTSFRLWNRLVDEVGTQHAPIENVWNFGGEKYGWSLRLRRNGRNLLYLTPQKRQFLVGISLGEKAVETAQKSELDADVLEVIASAPRYPEGRGIRLAVASRASVDAILTLLAIKLTGRS